MSYSKCRVKTESENYYKQDVIKQCLSKKIRENIDNNLYTWIEKNINEIVVEFDFHFLHYMKSLLNENPNNYRKQVENEYLNELIIKKEAEHKAIQERVKNYKQYVSKKNLK
jgi:hypothetical protein